MRTAVIFDNNPLGPQPWMRDVCTQIGLTFIEPKQVAQEMAKDATARDALLKSNGENLALAPYYQKGLEQVAGSAEKIGLTSVSWLAYGQKAAAVVVDLSGVEHEKKTGQWLRLSKEKVDGYVTAYRKKLDERLDKLGPASACRLMLEPGLSDAEKVKRAVAFLKPLV
jgi:hypothetical protein